MERIFITGGAGSGKTTLAARLAGRTGIPRYDVDRAERPPSIGGDWIVEGAHLWGMDDYVERADVVVWLDLPLRITIPRIVRRHLRLSLRRQNLHPGLRQLARFVAQQPAYARAAARAPTGPTDWSALTRAATRELVAPADDRLVHLTHPRQVSRWLRTSRDREVGAD